MIAHEIRPQAIPPDGDGKIEMWHVVEEGCLHALCGAVVNAEQSALPLAALADADPGACCDPCKQIHRATAAQVLDEPRGGPARSAY